MKIELTTRQAKIIAYILSNFDEGAQDEDYEALSRDVGSTVGDDEVVECFSKFTFELGLDYPEAELVSIEDQTTTQAKQLAAAIRLNAALDAVKPALSSVFLPSALADFSHEEIASAAHFALGPGSALTLELDKALEEWNDLMYGDD